MIDEVFFCLRVVLEISISMLGILLIYFFFVEHDKVKIAPAPESSQNDTKYIRTVDRSTNTDRSTDHWNDQEPPHSGHHLKIPLGVLLRSRRGRDGGRGATKRQAGIWSDSGYESFPSSCVFDPPQRECIARSMKEKIGQNGGTITLAGCFVLIPSNALAADYEIELSYFLEEPLQDGAYINMTPTVQLGPSGLTFKRPVTIILPSYYDAADPSKQPDVTIQMKQDEGDQWEECKIVKSHLQKKIVFHVEHFTKFRGIVKKIQSHLLKKQLYYAAFLKRYQLDDIPRMHTLVWCLCDNLPHTVQQMTAEMAQYYERVVESETLELRYGQDVCLELSCPSQIGVMPSTHCFKDDDLWPPGTSRKKLFNLHKPEIADVRFVTLDFKIMAKARGDDSLAVTRDGTGTFHWSHVLSQQDPCLITIIKDSSVNIDARQINDAYG